MSKPTFEEAAAAVEKVCRGSAAGAAVGALTGAALVVAAILIVDGPSRALAWDGHDEFSPEMQMFLLAWGGALPGIFVGALTGAAVSVWRLFRIKRLKFR